MMSTRIALAVATACTSLSAFAVHVDAPLTITVTATREAKAIAETPASLSAVDGEAIREQRPTHPSQILNQLPGVWLSTLSGEGHFTSIRHPLTTGAVYLYLEDGIPTRSTGFFNHNALYEINVPQAGGMEVSKGPGSALYGSDAIGGTINVLTRAPDKSNGGELTLEAGSHGWQRALGSASVRWGDAGRDGRRASVNLTRTDGWQDDAGYDRQAGTLRWDRALGDGANLTTVLSYSHVDQQHVGSLNPAQLRATPEHNNIPFSYRTVDALRLSSTFEKHSGEWLLSLTPYYRDNRMEIIPSWSVTYDPSQYVSANESFGLLAKVRRDFVPMRAQLIAGIDLDHSPGMRKEDSIRLASTPNAFGASDYTLNTATAPVRIYDYDVTYRGISPYLHGEISPIEPLRITAGLRYDRMSYDYDNHMADAATRGVLTPAGFPAGGFYGHAPSQKVSYSHLGPKLGATWRFSKQLSAFVNYANSFRTPSESQVFRGSRESNALRAQTQALSLIELKPVAVDNYETGVRFANGHWSGSLSVYDMHKSDDIVSYQDATLQRRTVNAGSTRHRGTELALGLRFNDDWRADLAWSSARHTYEKWLISGTTDYSGKTMEAAPRYMGHLALAWTPALLNGGHVRLAWRHVGSYWHDPANTQKYDGHTLLGLQVRYPASEHWELYANAENLANKRYADTVGGTDAAPTYGAGQPRTVTAGVQYRF